MLSVVFLMLFGVTATLIDVNAAQSKLVLLKNFSENYSKCLRLLYKVNAAEGVNVASEEVSTTELVSTAYYDEDVHDLRSVETKFQATVFNDELSSEKTQSYEPTVSSLNNNEYEFSVSFDESNDEDYTNEFPAIVYNDALMSKSYFLTEPTLCPQHIDKFDLKDETSLSKYEEVEQNVLYFNDLFSFYIIYPDNLKS
ncbi:hypothetical protein Tco_0791275 [Tanacetum coccineum]